MNVWQKIKDWFAFFGKKSPLAKLDVYAPAERMIYSYFDGEKLTKADPLKLYNAIAEKGQEIALDIKISRMPHKTAGEAHKKLIAKLRAIFAVKTLEEGGLSEVEVMNLFDHFLHYCDSVKKNASTWPTSSPSTEEEPPPTTEVPNPPTSPSSDSPSTKSGDASASPEQPPKASE